MMKNVFLILVFILFLVSCKTSDSSVSHIVDKDYEVLKVANEKAILVLFPCFPCDIENTKNEFPIIDTATKQNVSVVLMDYHNKLFLKDDEMKDLANLYSSIFEKLNLNSKNIYIGGFSGGGNVSLLLSNHLVKEKNEFLPKGVFIVDSPIDLLGLFRVAEKNIASNFSEDSLSEANWIISQFTTEFGNPKDSIVKYETFAPFTYETKNTSNLAYLKNLKIRFYTEPDLIWWKTNRNNDKEDLNAFFIEELCKDLKQKNFLNIELITTKNKGYRADRTRHPHSWSIVDKDELLKWIVE